MSRSYKRNRRRKRRRTRNLRGGEDAPAPVISCEGKSGFARYKCKAQQGLAKTADAMKKGAQKAKDMGSKAAAKAKEMGDKAKLKAEEMRNKGAANVAAGVAAVDGRNVNPQLPPGATGVDAVMAEAGNVKALGNGAVNMGYGAVQGSINAVNNFNSSMKAAAQGTVATAQAEAEASKQAAIHSQPQTVIGGRRRRYRRSRRRKTKKRRKSRRGRKSRRKRRRSRKRRR